MPTRDCGWRAFTLLTVPSDDNRLVAGRCGFSSGPVPGAVSVLVMGNVGETRCATVSAAWLRRA